MRQRAQGSVGRARIAFLAIAALLMSLVGVGLAGSASAASTLIVDDDLACPGATYSTIEDAVTASSNGDTIQICAGTYFENVNDFDHDLHFVGPQAGVDPRSAAYPRPGGEAFIEEHSGTVVILRGASTFDGFTIRGAFGNADVGMTVGNDVTVSNTVFTAVTTAVTVEGSGLAANQNLIDADERGFDFDGAGENSAITNNLFNGTFTDGAVGIDQFMGTPLDGMSITGNTLTSAAQGEFVISLGTEHLQVTDNVATGSGQQDAGIALVGKNFDFQVSGNVVTGFGGAGVSVFSTPGAVPNGSGTVERNVLRQNKIGLDMGHSESTGPNTGTVEAHYNVISGNNGPGTLSNPSAGIRNVEGGDLSATENFWGCNTGPNTAGCDATVGTVPANPWLLLSSTIGTKTLAATQATTFTASLNHDNLGGTVATPVLDGLPITFSASGGLTVNPAASTIINGVASTTVKPRANGGVGYAGQSVSGKVINAVTTQSAITVPPSPPTLTVHDASTTEGTSGSHTMNFSVTLSHKYTKAITVKFLTGNGTAKAPADYVAKSGTLTFPAGVTSKPIGITVKGDKVKESNENFVVTIYSPVNATIADPNALGVIRNS
jgi:hypothetical protein